MQGIMNGSIFDAKVRWGSREVFNLCGKWHRVEEFLYLLESYDPPGGTHARLTEGVAEPHCLAIPLHQVHYAVVSQREEESE